MNYKTMVLPFIALIALIVQLITGVKISEDVQGQIATAIGDVIAVSLIVYGIIINHKKKEEEEKK